MIRNASTTNLYGTMVVIDPRIGKTIGKIIPHPYGFDAKALPSQEDLGCWETHEQAIEAIIKHASPNV